MGSAETLWELQKGSGRLRNGLGDSKRFWELRNVLGVSKGSGRLRKFLGFSKRLWEAPKRSGSFTKARGFLLLDQENL